MLNNNLKLIYAQLQLLKNKYILKSENDNMSILRLSIYQYILVYVFAHVVNEKAIKWIYIQFFLPFSKNGEDIFDFHFN